MPSSLYLSVPLSFSRLRLLIQVANSFLFAGLSMEAKVLTAESPKVSNKASTA